MVAVSIQENLTRLTFYVKTPLAKLAKAEEPAHVDGERFRLVEVSQFPDVTDNIGIIGLD